MLLNLFTFELNLILTIFWIQWRSGLAQAEARRRDRERDKEKKAASWGGGRTLEEEGAACHCPDSRGWAAWRKSGRSKGNVVDVKGYWDFENFVFFVLKLHFCHSLVS